jgi:hypothetical protein
MENTDHNVQTRAQLFVVRKDDAHIPVFALRASDDFSAVPGLIMDLSATGVQVLTSSKAPINHANYTMELVSGHAEDAESSQLVALHLEWSRPDGVHVRNGFTFLPQAADKVSEHIQNRVNESDHGLLRCVLRPGT